MEKMFKGVGACPYTNNVIDSPPCRQCKWFYRAGTETFIWCTCSNDQIMAKSKLPSSKKTAIGEPVKAKRKTTTVARQVKKAKRGRPKKTEAAKLRPIKAAKIQNG